MKALREDSTTTREFAEVTQWFESTAQAHLDAMPKLIKVGSRAIFGDTHTFVPVGAWHELSQPAVNGAPQLALGAKLQAGGFSGGAEHGSILVFGWESEISNAIQLVAPIFGIKDRLAAGKKMSGHSKRTAKKLMARFHESWKDFNAS